MKLKVSELQGAALDWAVAECEQFVEDEFEPSENWTDGGPIIEREKIQLWVGQNWNASMEPNNINTDTFESGPTPLVAAMRCYVASQLGDEVEVPDELMEGEVK